MFSLDVETLKELVIKELSDGYPKETIELAIEKIPEVYTIVLKERAIMLNR